MVHGSEKVHCIVKVLLLQWAPEDRHKAEHILLTVRKMKRMVGQEKSKTLKDTNNRQQQRLKHLTKHQSTDKGKDTKREWNNSQYVNLLDEKKQTQKQKAKTNSQNIKTQYIGLYCQQWPSYEYEKNNENTEQIWEEWQKQNQHTCLIQRWLHLCQVCSNHQLVVWIYPVHDSPAPGQTVATGIHKWKKILTYYKSII